MNLKSIYPMKNEKATLARAAFVSAFLTALVIAMFTVMIVSCGTKETPSKDAEVIADEKNDAHYTAPKETDAQFIVNANVINLKEIQLGQLAQSNYALKDVSELGKMMEKEHTEAMKNLQALAAKKQITISKTLTGTETSEYDKLKNLVGAEFDKAYCDLMVKGHQDAINEYTQASLNSTDKEIKEWAESMIPSLKNHLEHAQHCQTIAGAKNDTQSK
jgi:putative membrane protein